MKVKNILVLSIGLLLAASLFSGCLGQNDDSPRIVEVADDESGFPAVFVDDGNSFIFDYKVTGAEFVDSISDTQFQKLITAESGKFLVVKFSAINRSKVEEYGNKPDFKAKYNNEEFSPQATASSAEELNEGVKEYAAEKVKSARKGKYVKVFEVTNYDESIQNFSFEIDGPGEADGAIEVDVAELNKGKL